MNATQQVAELLTDEVLARMSPRLETILRHRLAGETHAAIGERFGVSRGRIAQVEREGLWRLAAGNALSLVEPVDILHWISSRYVTPALSPECFVRWIQGKFSYYGWRTSRGYATLAAPCAGIDDGAIAAHFRFRHGARDIAEYRDRLIREFLVAHRKILHATWKPTKPFPIWMGWNIVLPPSVVTA